LSNKSEPTPSNQKTPENPEIISPLNIPDCELNKDERIINSMTNEQELIRTKHLETLNTNMMMEIYSNELEILLKELKVEDTTVQDKIKGIRKEIEK